MRFVFDLRDLAHVGQNTAEPWDGQNSAHHFYSMGKDSGGHTDPSAASRWDSKPQVQPVGQTLVGLGVDMGYFAKFVE